MNQQQESRPIFRLSLLLNLLHAPSLKTPLEDTYHSILGYSHTAYKWIGEFRSRGIMPSKQVKRSYLSQITTNPIVPGYLSHQDRQKLVQVYRDALVMIRRFNYQVMVGDLRDTDVSMEELEVAERLALSLLCTILVDHWWESGSHSSAMNLTDKKRAPSEKYLIHIWGFWLMARLERRKRQGLLGKNNDLSGDRIEKLLKPKLDLPDSIRNTESVSKWKPYQVYEGLYWMKRYRDTQGGLYELAVRHETFDLMRDELWDRLAILSTMNLRAMEISDLQQNHIYWLEEASVVALKKKQQEQGGGDGEKMGHLPFISEEVNKKLELAEAYKAQERAKSMMWEDKKFEEREEKEKKLSRSIQQVIGDDAQRTIRNQISELERKIENEKQNLDYLRFKISKMSNNSGSPSEEDDHQQDELERIEDLLIQIESVKISLESDSEARKREEEEIRRASDSLVEGMNKKNALVVEQIVRTQLSSLSASYIKFKRMEANGETDDDLLKHFQVTKKWYEDNSLASLATSFWLRSDELTALSFDKTHYDLARKFENEAKRVLEWTTEVRIIKSFTEWIAKQRTGLWERESYRIYINYSYEFNIESAFKNSFGYMRENPVIPKEISQILEKGGFIRTEFINYLGFFYLSHQFVKINLDDIIFMWDFEEMRNDLRRKEKLQGPYLTKLGRDWAIVMSWTHVVYIGESFFLALVKFLEILEREVEGDKWTVWDRITGTGFNIENSNMVEFYKEGRAALAGAVA